MTDDGQCHGRFTLPAATGAMLKKHLQALAASKRHPPSDDTAEAGSPFIPRPSAERLGQAFREYVERYPVDRTPHAGGVNASVTVTMTYADFTTATDTPAFMDTGEAITAAEARRLACDAGIIPVVLGGTSQPLDVGRARRFHTTIQRVVIALRDKTCTAEGCDWPPGMYHVHHDHPWSRGGTTSTTNGRTALPETPPDGPSGEIHDEGDQERPRDLCSNLNTTGAVNQGRGCPGQVHVGVRSLHDRSVREVWEQGA